MSCLHCSLSKMLEIIGSILTELLVFLKRWKSFLKAGVIWACLNTEENLQLSIASLKNHQI